MSERQSDECQKYDLALVVFCVDICFAIFTDRIIVPGIINYAVKILVCADKFREYIYSTNYELFA